MKYVYLVWHAEGDWNGGYASLRDVYTNHNKAQLRCSGEAVDHGATEHSAESGLDAEYWRTPTADPRERPKVQITLERRRVCTFT